MVFNLLEEFEYKKDIFDFLSTSQEGVVFSISIDNFFLFLMEKRKILPEKIMKNLQNLLCSETEVTSFRLTYNVILLLKNKITEQQVVFLLEKICFIMDNFVGLKLDNPVYIRYSIGYKYYNMLNNIDNISDILDKSIIALHTAIIKKDRKLCNYDTELPLSITHFYEQMLKISYLNYDVLTNTIKLAFQPIICTKKGKVVFYESLLRISINKEEIISAGEFVQAIENFGLITKVDKIVFYMVINELLADDTINLSVNISTYSLEDSDFLLFCTRLLTDRKVSDRLIIEITETGFQTNYAQINKFIDRMRDMGCRIAIDDFGSGYTSIQQLSIFSVDFIKIDGSFVNNLKNNKKNQFIIDVMTKIANGLGVKTIAEFVDELETINILKKIGIDYMQGNYFNPAEIRKFWLEN